MKTLYGKNKKKDVERTLQVGDVVRLSMVTRPFRRGYLPQWTEEIFVVDKVFQRQPTVYAVKDFDGEEAAGTFYAEELQKIGKKKPMLSTKSNTFFVHENAKTERKNTWSNGTDIPPSSTAGSPMSLNCDDERTNSHSSPRSYHG